MFKKGRTKTGGRVKGTPNKAKLARMQAEAEARERLAQARLASQEEIQQAAARMHTMSPLEVMLTGMHLKLGRGDLDGAQKIAEAAAPYTAPRLNATDVRVQTVVRSDAEITAEIEALREKIERARSAALSQIEATVVPAGKDQS